MSIASPSSRAHPHAKLRRRLVLAVGATAAAVAMRIARAAATPPAATPRIVTIGGALTEIVYRLDAQRLLVATDTTSTYPTAALALPKVGYQRSLSAEGLLALQPTLLIAGSDAGPPAALAQLQEAGLRIVRANGEHSFEAMVDNVARVAESVERRIHGNDLTRGLTAEWNDTRRAIRPRATKPRVLFVLSHAANNVQVAGDGTAAAAMIALAGGTNAMSGLKGYRPLSSEAALDAAPDVVLVTREGLDALGGVEPLLLRPGLSLTPAGRARRVLALDALYLLGFGPRLPHAVRDLAQGLGTLG